MSAKPLETISEKTLLPISFVVVLIVGIAWIIRLEARVDAAAKDSQRLEQKQDEYNKIVRRVDSRLSRIEGKLGIQGNADQ